MAYYTGLKARMCILLLAMACSLVWAGPAAAEEPTGDDDSPALTSQAQVDRAENLAAVSADKAQADYDTAQNDVADAESALGAIDADQDPDAYAAAVAARDLALDRLAAAEDNLGGVPAGEIAAMRDDGMGWGQIAHSLGIHPGNLGLGHHKATHANEFSQATARDVQGGLSKGHGAKGDGRGASSGKGNAGKGTSGKGSSGKGGSNGKGGGKGGGNGGGNGKK
ncbi:MAG: hypothetical protein HUN04_25235 [Desulfobacter sp.]|nr:MAG: hypothetical protein HUN04_25235 [Desulfobacter sp.]